MTKQLCVASRGSHCTESLNYHRTSLYLEVSMVICLLVTGATQLENTEGLP